MGGRAQRDDEVWEVGHCGMTPSEHPDGAHHGADTGQIPTGRGRACPQCLVPPSIQPRPPSADDAFPCRMQPEGEGLLLQPEFMHLHGDMWARQQRALRRASEPAAREAEAAIAAAKQAGVPDLTGQPDCVKGGRLFPHQLAGVSWLRRQWVEGTHAVLADDSGMGKTATVVAFLQCVL